MNFGKKGTIRRVSGFHGTGMTLLKKLRALHSPVIKASGVEGVRRKHNRITPSGPEGLPTEDLKTVNFVGFLRPAQLKTCICD